MLIKRSPSGRSELHFVKPDRVIADVSNGSQSGASK